MASVVGTVRSADRRSGTPAPAPSAAPPPVTRPHGPRRLPAHWPLSLAFLGLPLWWVLGLHILMPILLSAVMVDHLVRRRRIRLPAGFTLWALLLVWVALGVFVLWADAPGAVPGGGASRLLVFAYRLAWYGTATVFLLWVANLRESELPTRWVHQVFGWVFVVTVLGGLVGVLWPAIEFRSPLELAMPGGIRGNSLVQAIVHPAVADVQTVLGRPQARPKAPWAYANSWGSVLALTLPFFLVGWLRHGARWQRLAAPAVLAVATVPVVLSLNRGLWACLVIGAVGLLLLQARTGRLAPILTAVAGLLAAAVLVVASPLGDVVGERFENQHSNDRRGQLTVQTVTSTVEGSPVVGFGSTRDVQGSFSSIAGGAVPDCSACGVPPLGTQGQLWLVLFSQGLVGAALFLSFFAIVLSRTWRCRTTTETVATFVLVFFGFQVLIYDTLGVPLLAVMAAVGLVAREQWANRRTARPVLLNDAVRRLRSGAPVLAVLALLGALLGGVATAQETVMHGAKVSILLSQAPVYLSSADLGDEAALPRDITVDTEAALTVSRASLSRVLGTTDPERLRLLRERILVSAPENTRVLTIEVRATSADRADLLATAVAGSYLKTRRDYLSARRDQSLAILRERLGEITQPTVGVLSTSVEATRLRIEQALTETLYTPTTAGEVIRTEPAKAVRRQGEVAVTSGIALGVLAGTALVVAFPGRAWPRPTLSRREAP